MTALLGKSPAMTTPALLVPETDLPVALEQAQWVPKAGTHSARAE